ncbi:MAG: class I SAM-dependent methyltransferase [Desulfomonilaceae bacterium]
MTGTLDTMPELPPHVEKLSVMPGKVDFIDGWYEVEAKYPNHFWFQWRWAIFRRMLKSVGLRMDAELAALDVGCGTGILRSQLEGHSAWSVDAAEVNPTVIQSIPQGRGRTLCYDVRDEIKELLERYDVVLLFDVLEHIPDPVLFLRSVWKHVRQGGMLIVNVPALPSLYNVYDESVGHVWRYDKRLLLQQTEAAGFQALDVRYWGFPMIPLLVLRKLLFSTGKKRDKAEILTTGLVPPGPATRLVLGAIKAFELTILPRPPIGTSLMLAAKKS